MGKGVKPSSNELNQCEIKSEENITADETIKQKKRKSTSYLNKNPPLKDNDAYSFKSSNSNSPDDSKEEENILEDLDLEYEKLQSNNQLIKSNENVCGICEMSGPLIECQGQCFQSYHLDCIGLLLEPANGFKCTECISGLHTCFSCKKPSVPESNMATKKCSVFKCGKYYHDECIQSNELFRKDVNTSNKTSNYICPLHSCLTCVLESKYDNHHHCLNDSDLNNPKEANSAPLISSSISLQPFKGRFMKCVRCPTAYHSSEFCIAAGSLILEGCFIVCPNHFLPIKTQNQHNRVNVTWCFVCCKNGELIGCNNCPAAYHYSCLENPPATLLASLNNLGKKSNYETKSSSPCSSPPHSPSSTTSASTISTLNSVKSVTHAVSWKCEDCQHGKRPLYGEIIWAKVGLYRWWPAQICLPCNLPDNIREKHFQVGEFPVKFFGSNDYFWVSIGRCFAFADGDEFQKSSAMSKSLGLAYKDGVKQAIVAFKEINKLKQTRLSKAIGRDSMKFAMQNFQFIRTNKPVGNVTNNKMPLCDLPRCDCDPKSANPCGTDDCMNRVLKYECHAAICPAGERCKNQRFMKRQYPKQEPLPTGGRGFGLKTLVNIKKGEFVNEYVGELIDDKECKRRLEMAHKNDIRNFYFLTIEKDRIIDAGPKGNLARFMNHSCEPNCETQKWMVNGDIRVGLFAKVDIPMDTELTFNYNLDCLSNEKAECKCGSNNCSGFIGVRPKNNTNNTNELKGFKSNQTLLNSDTKSNAKNKNILSKKEPLKIDQKLNKTKLNRVLQSKSKTITAKALENLKLKKLAKLDKFEIPSSVSTSSISALTRINKKQKNRLV